MPGDERLGINLHSAITKLKKIVNTDIDLSTPPTRSDLEYRSTIQAFGADIASARRLVNMKAHSLHEVLFDVLRRWPRSAINELDIPGLLFLRILHIVAIVRPVHEQSHAIIVELQDRVPASTPLPPLIWRPGDRPVAMLQPLRDRLETLGLDTSSVALRFKLGEPGSANSWMDRLVGQVAQHSDTQIAYDIVGLLESREIRQASVDLAADARAFDEVFKADDEDITPEELKSGIDVATADLNWALDLIGPPPAPTDTSSGTSSPLQPLGQSR